MFKQFRRKKCSLFFSFMKTVPDFERKISMERKKRASISYNSLRRYLIIIVINASCAVKHEVVCYQQGTLGSKKRGNRSQHAAKSVQKLTFKYLFLDLLQSGLILLFRINPSLSFRTSNDLIIKLLWCPSESFFFCYLREI